jgi:hypothetical protein
MKKILAIIALASVAAASVQAQGLVIFGNGSTSRINTNAVASGGAIGLTSATANSFYYALFYSTSATAVGGSTASVSGPSANGYVFNAANAASWTQTTTGLANNTSAGRFLSSSADANSATIVNGLTGGSSASFVVLGWSANLGSTVSALEASLAATSWTGLAFMGESNVSGLLTAGDGNLIPTPALFGPSAPAMQAFTLGVLSVPEPGTLALAALGVSSLLMLRRKK